MITTGIDMSGLNRGIAGLIRRAGIEAKIVVSKETSELVKTLVKISPPRNPTKTRKTIASDIRNRFEMASDSYWSDQYAKTAQSPSGMRWYTFDHDFLRGVSPVNDLRNASVETLDKLRWKVNKYGCQVLPFKHPRTYQRVLLSQTILTRKSTLNALVRKAQAAVGRLKAGWLVSVFVGSLQLSGVNLPPQWVTRHQKGARGRFEDGRNRPTRPYFKITNTARGISQSSIAGLIRAAVNIRARAMATNLRMMLSGKKKLSDYA